MPLARACAVGVSLLLLGSAVTSTQAACTGYHAGTPSPQAVTIFLTANIYNGDLVTQGKVAATSLSLDPNTVGNGIEGADMICQNEAISTGTARIKALAQTNGFQAFLVGHTGSVFDGFDVTADVQLSDGSCLAPNLPSLLNPGPPATMTSGLTKPNGATTGPDQFWTGTDSTTGTEQTIAGSCGSFSSSSSGATGETGFSQQTGAHFMTFVSSACNTLLSIACVSVQSATVSGDPQFYGLQGQSFQVHGIPDEWFNLVSSPTMQLNSKFAYLDSGSCSYNNTACWTHPGTYNSELGFMFPGLQIHLIAGTHKQGCQLQINGVLVSPSSGHLQVSNVTVSHHSHDHVTIRSSLFTFKITNSDMFFNFAVEMHDTDLLQAGRTIHHIKEKNNNSPYPHVPLHGLIGGTWRNARYGAHSTLYEGSVEDYLVLDGLWGIQFHYNQYPKHQHAYA